MTNKWANRGRQKVAPVGLEEVVGGEDGGRDGEADESEEQDRNAAGLVHERRGDGRDDDLHHLDANGEKVGGGRVGVDGLEDGAAVEHHGVDAGELLDEHEANADGECLGGGALAQRAEAAAAAAIAAAAAGLHAQAISQKRRSNRKQRGGLTVICEARTADDSCSTGGQRST